MDSYSLGYIFYLFLVVGLPLTLPLLFGVLILKNYWRDGIGRLAGLLTIKPVITYPLWFFLAMTPNNRIDFSHQNNNLFTLTQLFIPDIALTIIIFLFSLGLVRKNPFLWLFFVGDIIRWGNIFMIYVFQDINIIKTLAWLIVLFGMIFPSIYGAISYEIMSRRFEKSRA